MRRTTWMFLAGLAVLPGCYNSYVVGTVEYAISELPEREKPAHMEVLAVRVVEAREPGSGKARAHRFASVYVTKPQWRRMARYARKLRERRGEWITVYFFAHPERAYDLSEPHEVPERLKPFLAFVYRDDRDGVIQTRDPAAFERAREDLLGLN